VADQGTRSTADSRSDGGADSGTLAIMADEASDNGAQGGACTGIRNGSGRGFVAGGTGSQHKYAEKENRDKFSHYFSFLVIYKNKELFLRMQK
jgi:hypothetical protein